MLAEFNGDRSQIYAYSDQNSFAPLARIDASGDDSQIYYYHNQVNGQPEAMTDREGNECWRGEPDFTSTRRMCWDGWIRGG
ncbi:RHS domain-containing protein [Rahnella woolbedingensis]|uniref:RHS domain-containing protein n=1 Tax=Rahnella woolbedingensis TaxID=1510574 RepID=UPI003CC56DA2